MAICVCQQCGREFEFHSSPAKVKKRKYCSNKCAGESYKIRFKGRKDPPGAKRMNKIDNPEWAAKISKTSKERSVNVGEKNGMKNPEARVKASKTRRERITSDPEYRKHLSKKTREAWEDGKFDHVSVGCCKWYEHIRPDGTIVKLQGTWEVIFARWLDSNDVKYDAHRGRISYVDKNGETHNYYPDFYVLNEDCYYDVKGAFFDDLQRQKFESIRSSNPRLKLRLITKEVFSDLGIDINKESLRFITSLNSF